MRIELFPYQKVDSYRDSGFFLLRTPLLAFEEFLDWGKGLAAPDSGPADLALILKNDRSLLSKRLKDIVLRPEIREGLFLASSVLASRIDIWTHGDCTQKGSKIERSLVKYFSRMAARTTPFGLFAGCSTGLIGNDTHFLLDKRENYQKSVQLSMEYVFALCESLARTKKLIPHLTFYPNSTHYRAYGSIRYIESFQAEKDRSNALVAIDASPYLNFVLQRARKGRLPKSLVFFLVKKNVSRNAAEAYIQSLIENQLLISDLCPPVTEKNRLSYLIGKLGNDPKTVRISKKLRKISTELSDIEASGLGTSIAQYHKVAKTLASVSAENVELSKVFQIEMKKPAAKLILSSKIVNDIISGVQILQRLCKRKDEDELSLFRKAFIKRYDTKEIPLVEALDEDCGIGFNFGEQTKVEDSPLLKDLKFPSRFDHRTGTWDHRDTFWLRKLNDAIKFGTNEILLDEKDLAKISDQKPSPLPDAFCAVVALGAHSVKEVNDGHYLLYLSSVVGPSGARLLGRFCVADDALRRHVEKHLYDEEALHPGAVFAEIVHLPEGRIGNILQRPVMRKYEIPFFGNPSVGVKKQISISDIMVSVRKGEIILRSKRLNRRVLPRLTSAHNFDSPQNSSIYRFLCLLQQQGICSELSWDWGVLGEVRFLPRVRFGRILFSRAQWKLNKDDAQIIKEKKEAAAQFTLIQLWRKKYKIPRFVALMEGDNELPVDLDNILSVETFFDMIQKRDETQLVELFPEADKLCVKGPEGSFVHEIIVPFVREKNSMSFRSKPQGPSLDLTCAKTPKECRTFAPGSEWLYCKFYTGESTADDILRAVIYKISRWAIRSRIADRWYFVRYKDPDFHLRLRIHGIPKRLYSEVVPRIESAIAPHIETSRIWSMQIDTYEREIERYGGFEGTILSEEFFFHDSETVMNLIELHSLHEYSDFRWQLAFVGIDRILSDFNLDLNIKCLLLQKLHETFAEEHSADMNIRHQLGRKYRQERKFLELLATTQHYNNSILYEGIQALNSRSLKFAPIISRLRVLEAKKVLKVSMVELAESYIHMYVNRLLQSAPRAHEMVLYDFLHQIYKSQSARQFEC